MRNKKAICFVADESAERIGPPHISHPTRSEPLLDLPDYCVLIPQSLPLWVNTEFNATARAELQLRRESVHGFKQLQALSRGQSSYSLSLHASRGFLGRKFQTLTNQNTRHAPVLDVYGLIHDCVVTRSRQLLQSMLCTACGTNAIYERISRWHVSLETPNINLAGMRHTAHRLAGLQAITKYVVISVPFKSQVPLAQLRIKTDELRNIMAGRELSQVAVFEYRGQYLTRVEG